MMISLLFFSSVFATYTPQTTLIDPVSGYQAYINSSNELKIIVGTDSNVCKEAGGNLTAILSALGSPLQAGGSVSVSNFPVTQPISAASLPLPSGAATSALQSTLNSTLGSPMQNSGGSVQANAGTNLNTSLLTLESGGNLAAIFAKLSSSVAVTGTFFQATQPVSAATLPLPSGASTSTNQTTGNNSLASIDGKITAVNTGAVVISNSALPSGASTSALQTTGNTSLSSIDTKLTSPLTINAPVNTVGSGSAAAATVSTVTTLTAPANAVGFILMNMDTSTTNMRWAVGRTASATLGQQLQPGRDSGFVPVGANVSIIAESGTVTYDVQWISR